MRKIAAGLVLSAIVSGAVSCGLIGTDECPQYAARCNGNVRESCELPCAEFGCGLKWQSYGDCGAEKCVDLGQGTTICALSSSQDPKCSGEFVRGYCDGSFAVSCRAGYAASRSECAAVEQVDSGASPGTPTCVSETLDVEVDAMCTTAEKWCGPREATCNAPGECGPVVGSVVRSEAVPVPAGGVIQDGLYFLTDVNEYGGSPVDPSIPIQATRRIQNGVLTSAVYGDMDPTQSSGPFTVEGTNLVWAVSCPAASATTFGFTATDSTLTLYETRGSSVYELVHRLQGQ